MNIEKKLRCFSGVLFTLSLLVSGCKNAPSSLSEPLATVHFDHPFLWKTDQPAEALRIHFALKPGSRISNWKKAAQSARANGRQLPDRPAVAQLTIVFENGREIPIGIRYGESIGAHERDWWNETDGFIYSLPFARLSSVGLSDTLNRKYAVQYAMDVPNPMPGVRIQEIQLAIPDSLNDGALITVYQLEEIQAPPAVPTYFVAPYGNDNQEGRFDTPWATLQHAAKAIAPGSTVFVRGGQYTCTAPVLFDSLLATAGHPTRVIGWPGETARFDFKATHLTYGSNPFGTGEGWLNLDQAMFSIDHCKHFVLKNLHLQHSRARGIGAEYGENISLLYNSVYLTFSPGIRFAHIDKGEIIGNTLIRPTSILMGPTRLEDAGSAPLAMDTGDSTFINPNQPLYMPEINAAQGERSRKPPMEGIDGAHFSNIEVGYNEIAWADKETFLIDGDVDELRVHHNYVHDAHNRPWAWGIAPNGYGKQQHIELDHNIAVRVGSGVGIGTEGGGTGAYVRIHHNLSYDCAWNAHSVTGAWGDSDADLKHIAVFNNTAWRNGYLDSNSGPAGGIAISFPSGEGKAGRKVNGVVEDVTVANNLILQPRDYALALVYPGDPAGSRINFYKNYTDLKTPSSIFDLPENAPWRSYRTTGLEVVEGSILRDPEAGDFRLRAGNSLLRSGVGMDSSGQIDTSLQTYIGAFGPNDGWVEYPKRADFTQKPPSQ
ncbi:MAG: hypothetical protein RIC19_13685 [Phaeodactylibacter sp.]|uniref:hypothetical protein n=1 Tax=Phaeodactylibacter sp. TaxID=1940289 RepID=UPI0032EFE1BA